MNLKIDNKKFNSYLAGLFEGNGHIWFTKINTKKIQNPRFCITFNLKDELLAKRLIYLIGYGFIKYKPKKKTCVLTILPVKGLKNIISLINGELRTPKIRQLYSLIDWVNKNHSSNIPKLKLKKGELNKDSWLAGFVEAEGSFSVQYTKKKKISCRIRIEQIMEDPVSKLSYKDVLTDISKFLNCNLKTRKQVSTGNEYYIITASNRASLCIIINYFNIYPLLSSKYLDFKDWKIAADLILSNNHYSEQGISNIELIRNSMNLNRKDFNWDHLMCVF
jgi:LAGLIDADG DNA endonuclease family protein